MAQRELPPQDVCSAEALQRSVQTVNKPSGQAGLSAACLRRARNRSACHHRANVLIWEKTTPPRFPPAALLTLVGSTASAHQVLFEGRHFIRCIPVWRCADPPHEVQFWQRTKSSIRWIFGVVQYRPPGRWIDSHQCCALYALDSVRC